jgi:cysteine synthase A
MPDLHPNILATIGDTPVVRLNALAPAHATLYAKLEAFNPMGSVKDRLALSVIEAAERDGTLRPGQTVVEASSGNTGIGLAMVCAVKGYPLVVVMAESFSVERRRLMRFLGARVVLTPAADKGTGMAAKARELAERHGWFLARQFENPANAEIHARTTAREILAAFEGRRLDAFVTGTGTGGTLNGIARVLKAERPEVQIVVAEPDNVPIVASGIAQAVRDDGSPAASHPMFRPHLMQGWTPDFIPKLTQGALDAHHVDRVIGVNGARALAAARDLARREGIFCGISAGATLVAAQTVAETLPAGSAVLFMVPDTGERYLSTPLFADIPEEMTEAELEIAASTDGYRIGGPSRPAPADAPVREPTAEGAAWFDAAISDPEQPVVMFALEWCEFCWALRKFLAGLGIPYRSVDLDSVEFQQGDLGGDLRAVLRQRTGEPTIPQVFVGGTHVGGCTATFDAYADGSLLRLLDRSGIPHVDGPVDTASLLPKWLHPREVHHARG